MSRPQQNTFFMTDKISISHSDFWTRAFVPLRHKQARVIETLNVTSSSRSPFEGRYRKTAKLDQDPRTYFVELCDVGNHIRHIVLWVSLLENPARFAISLPTRETPLLGHLPLPLIWCLTAVICRPIGDCLDHRSFCIYHNL